ncbi:MAG: hypothetical protein RMM98_18350, partial [Acidobacteriota bacterium]|nr:hypothetical protein [Acidobacteriota bacterium]
MGTVWQDLRYGLRMLLKHPGFTAVAVVTLALGIGANTAIFSIVTAVLLRPLAFEAPERLFIIWETVPRKGILDNPVSYPNFRDWKERNRVFEEIAVFRS